MSLEIIDSTQAFEALGEEWNALTDETLRSHEWHLAWWKQFGEENQLRIYGFRVDNRLVGILPMFVDRWMGQSRIRYLGSGDTCTDYARIIGDSRYHADFSEQVAKNLTRNLGMGMVELEGTTESDSRLLVTDLTTNNYWRYQKNLEPTWVLDLPGTWKEFIANSKKSLRRKIKKADSRLNSPEFRVESSLENLTVEEAFETLVELHQDRFTSQGKPGVFADSRFYHFLKEATESLHQKQKIEILVGYYNEEPFIAQIYLSHPCGPKLYQAGIRSTHMHLEPGHFLLTFAVRRAIENGFEQFDMLRGNHAYKPYWGAQPRELFKLRMVSPKLIPSTINRSYQILRGVKHLVTDFTRAHGNRFDKSA